MCGIAGIFDLCCQKKIRLNNLQQMISAVRHRGPDEFGAYLDNSVGLAHARLSVIDLHTGIQPIHNEKKTIWITFNGEIYNYIELRDELIDKGHKFYTNTDTEVIIHLYEEYGTSFLDSLNGQFAFALWDSIKDVLFLARDRFGIRPLHYTFTNNKLLFASEIKSIFTQNYVKREINLKALNHLFTYWATLPGDTIFTGIKEIPAGYYLTVTKKNSYLIKYYDLPAYKEEEKLDQPLNIITNELDELLYDSVKLRLRSDVPVGSYLSGGIDSSIIASIAKNKFNNDLNTFGIRFSNQQYDEGEYQSEIVSHLNTRHKEIWADSELVAANFNNVIWNTEKPLLRTAPIPLYLLSGLVRNNDIKVVLTGEGADEFFGGYNIYREAKARWFWSKNIDSNYRPKLLSKLYPYIFTDGKLGDVNKSFFGKGLEKSNKYYFSHLIRWENSNKVKQFFNNEINDLDDYSEFEAFLPENFKTRDWFEKAQYIEVKTLLSGYLLSSQGDRMAMANSVEVRFPFLDHRLIDYLAKIPSRFKIYGMNEKFLLKKIFRDRLPDKIIRRNKHPYRAPIVNTILASQNEDYFKEYLSRDSILELGIFNPTKVQKLFEKANKLGNLGELESMAISGIYSTQVVYDKFIKNYKVSPKSDFKFDLFVDNRTKGKEK